MFKHRAVISDVISGLFILLFVYAATAKLLDYQKFEIQLGRSPVLAPFSHWAAWSVPLLEYGISAFLLFKKFQQFALYMCFSLMAVFSGYIITILHFSTYIPCSCGGILENMSWKQHLVFNLFFVLLGAAGVLLYPVTKETIAIGRGSRKP